MGEFLLSIIGYDAGRLPLIYISKPFRAKFKVGDNVNICNPNPHRKVATAYYRVYGFFYPIELMHELVRSQNPNVIDQNGYVAGQRRIEDSKILAAVSEGATIQELATQYKWHAEAIKLALVRAKSRIYAEREAERIQEQEGMTYIPADTPEMKAKIQKVLENWS